MKKISILFLLLLFLLTACGQNNSSSNLALNNNTTKDCYEKILNNEEVFYSTIDETDILLSDYNKKVWQYSFIDMDADNTDELAIMFEDGSVLLLRKSNTSAVGFYFGNRGMTEIYTNGAFLWNEDEGNTYGCSKLEFDDKTCNTIELWRVENNDLGSAVY